MKEALEEANNTMISENKENLIKKNYNKEKNKISNIIDEINNEIEGDYNDNLDIDNIFEINKKFNYSKDLPVFYIKEKDNYNDNEDYKGPLSTNEIKKLIRHKKMKNISFLDIKLIDIFTMKNHQNFEFFDFDEIFQRNWSKNLEYSDIFLQEHNKLKENELIKEKEKEKEQANEKKVNKKEKKMKIMNNNNINNNFDNKDNDISFSLNYSIIDKGGFNDLSMSIIKQLQGVPLTKKQVDKITSIIEEVEEDEWKEVKPKKKNKNIEEKNDLKIVGLNENKKTIKKNKKIQKKNNYNDKNIFSGLKIEYKD